jgi:hypothetical protein
MAAGGVDLSGTEIPLDNPRRKAGRHLMKIPMLSFTVTDWAGVPRAVHPAEMGAKQFA